MSTSNSNNQYAGKWHNFGYLLRKVVQVGHDGKILSIKLENEVGSQVEIIKLENETGVLAEIKKSEINLIIDKLNLLEYRQVKIRTEDNGNIIDITLANTTTHSSYIVESRVTLLAKLEKSPIHVQNHQLFSRGQRNKVAHQTQTILPEKVAKRQLLLKIIEETGKLSSLSCTNLDLQKINFEGVEIFDVDFSGSNMTGCNFVSANLANSDFSGCDLLLSNFSSCSIMNTKFHFAKLNEMESRSLGKNDGHFTVYRNHSSFNNAKLGIVDFFGIYGLNIDGAIYSENYKIIESECMQTFSIGWCGNNKIIAYKSEAGWRVNLHFGDYSIDDYVKEINSITDYMFRSLPPPEYRIIQFAKLPIHYINDMINYENQKSQ